MKWPVITASTNVLGPWLCTYPLVGAITIYYYYMFVPDMFEILKVALDEDAANEHIWVKCIVNDEKLTYDEEDEEAIRGCLKNFFFGGI